MPFLKICSVLESETAPVLKNRSVPQISFKNRSVPFLVHPYQTIVIMPFEWQGGPARFKTFARLQLAGWGACSLLGARKVGTPNLKP